MKAYAKPLLAMGISVLFAGLSSMTTAQTMILYFVVCIWLETVTRRTA